MAVSARIGVVLLDIEGTLLDRGQPLPGALRTVEALRTRGLTLRFLTNIDSRTPEQIRDDLRQHGLEITLDELFTPLVAVQRYLEVIPDARVYALMSDSLRALLEPSLTKAPYTHVVVGDCRTGLTYSTLDQAFQAVQAGAQLLALQRGRYYQGADGDHLDTGAIVAALEYAAETGSLTLGKPSREFFGLAIHSTGQPAGECAVVGDDADTDIVGGRAVGALTIQVRTGKYRNQLAPDGVADRTIDSIADLMPLFG